MGANKSKLIEEIEAKNCHNISNISIDDLIIEDNNNTCSYEVSTKIYKNLRYINDGETNNPEQDQEEEEQTVNRYLELFKRDLMINFADPSSGKDIGIIPNNNGNYYPLP